MPAIKVENLSKEYAIGTRRAGRETFREKVAGVLAAPFRRGRGAGGAPARTERFWALKDVSFEVAPGDVVGIIGSNGAGKSTLLKILSRITAPTAGRVELRGRMSSLLEVGTGFHPELTGRENVFLNGSLLGMSRAEIRRKFDEIVAFAEVERFLDTPVKHYSSGMYVRLAFAVAAHLDPEIIVVDEVLAVGDLQFQKKCLSKMDEVASEGKTVLLVSHNMSSILALSTKCLLLAEGRLVAAGSPPEIVARYQRTSSGAIFGKTDLSGTERYGNGKARFLSIALRPLGVDGGPLAVPETGCDLEFEVRIRSVEGIADATVALIIYDELGARLIDANTLIKGSSLSLRPGEESTVRFLLKNVRLKPAVYVAGLWLGILNNADIDGIRYATAFRMESRREDVLYTHPFPGVYACDFACRVGTGG